ncbi:MAG: response regulator [Desulfuromonadales bacterium]|nr:response regulator [Desulfuromonadales bacterium]
MALQKPDRILIVDDEADIAAILKLHLEDSGYLTAWAGNGEAALEMLKDGGYSLVLMDIRMPGMNGVTVLNRIREAGLDAAVIMMTAHGNEDLAVECMQSGAVDYFSKPFSLDDMLQRVERAIANRNTLLEKQRLEQEKEDFFFMLSHDLKNPITVVVGSIDIMREGRLGPVNPEQVEYLQSAIDSCNEVVAMIDNLLDVQRFESGRMPVVIRPYQPEALAAAAVERFSKSAEYEEIELTLDTDGDSTEVAVDRNLLNRVFANLLVNAIKFTPSGGSITVSCRCVRNSASHRIRIPVHVASPAGFAHRNCFVRISIKDTGNGIPHEDLDHIFDRFTQSHNAFGREKGGAGLGLAFCKMAVESFNGIIWAESEAGAGSEFIILLPCYPGNSRCDKHTSETHP